RRFYNFYDKYFYIVHFDLLKPAGGHIFCRADNCRAVFQLQVRQLVLNRKRSAIRDASRGWPVSGGELSSCCSAMPGFPTGNGRGRAILEDESLEGSGRRD
ncbi:MAG: hypothetical protein KDH19_21170, partial [Geminicoccaceae bacterium]|nr:hypothetical protein [Geminicoccaceae bacterium]